MSDSAITLLRENQRWFTPAEATALLPELVELIEDLASGVDRANEVKELLDNTRDPQGQWAVSQDLNELQEANRELLDRVLAHGVELKGLTPARVDFPAMHGGREVYLCWREGETAVTWWHPLHTGERGRRPIEPDSDSDWNYWS